MPLAIRSVVIRIQMSPMRRRRTMSSLDATHNCRQPRPCETQAHRQTLGACRPPVGLRPRRETRAKRRWQNARAKRQRWNDKGQSTHLCCFVRSECMTSTFRPSNASSPYSSCQARGGHRTEGSRSLAQRRTTRKQPKNSILRIEPVITKAKPR